MFIPTSRLILIASLALSACSGGESGTTPQAARLKQPCDLLTAQDIQQVTGHEMQPGEAKQSGFCAFSSVEKGNFDQPKYTWRLQYLHHTVALAQEVEAYHNSVHEGLGNDAKSYITQAVPGVGDQAFWEGFPGVTYLAVFKSAGAGASDFFSLQTEFTDEAMALDESKALAQRVLQRL